MSYTPQQEQELRHRLEGDTVFYAEKCLKIVDQREQTVPLAAKPAQLRLEQMIRYQEENGMPVRVIVLKARKEGLCLDPSTRVLTRDLRWVPIDDLLPGDELMATDENPPGGRGNHRRMRVGVVEAKRDIHGEAFRLRMRDGRELIATPNHRFLVKAVAGAKWREVRKMKVGDKIRFITGAPWEDADYEDGWFGGFIDGEGSFRAKERAGCELTVHQRPGATYDRARQYLIERGYTFREEVDERTVEEAPGRFGSNPINRLKVNRIGDVFRLLGQTRPTRFVDMDWWEGKELPGKRSGVAYQEIIAIEPLGERRMVDLQTSTKTFIAEGFVSHNSTWVQGRMIKRISQRKNHKALVIAHDGKTAGELFEIGETMYSHLPNEMVGGLHLKPPVISSRKGKELKLGEPSRQRRLEGHVGLNSSYYVDTANEYEAGRGFTYHSLHISELGFWQSAETKLKALLNSVPDAPNTMIIIESTANGYNRFRKMWLDAEKRRSDYLPLFIAWFEDPDYERPFANEEEREEFIAQIGTGPYGDDEPKLIEEYGVRPEQLRWRRWAIANRCQGDLRTFWQEYPASPAEAFLSTGKQVFSPMLVSKMVERTVVSDPEAEKGLLRPESWRPVERRGRTIEVPVGAKWMPEKEADLAVDSICWQVWEHPLQADWDLDPPQLGGQYIVTVDPASGEETESGDEDYFSIQVINHRTREQVATWKARHIDADLVALEAHSAAVYFNRAWIGIETTGGYGLSIAKKIWKEWRYGKIYFRKPPASKSEKQEKRLGWHTGGETKPLLVDTMKELLRRGRDGVKSQSLAGEFLTFVKDEHGKMGAEEDEHDDELMAYMIAQYIADEKPIAPERRPGSAPERKVNAPSMNRRPRAYNT